MPWAFAELLGMRPTSMGDGRARFELDVAPNHLNPNGTVHGGVIYSLADSAMGTALFSQLDGRQWCATLEIKMNYLLPVTGGTIAAEATVISRTQRIGVLEAKVFGDGDRLVALATGTFYIQLARASE
ncbi:MAG: PaaI family thioesterase [Candidatus Rokuibacteriota bacterium]